MLWVDLLKQHSCYYEDGINFPAAHMLICLQCVYMCKNCVMNWPEVWMLCIINPELLYTGLPHVHVLKQ